MAPDTLTRARAPSAELAQPAEADRAHRPASRQRPLTPAWFVADTSSGSLGLALTQGATPPRHAADAALALWAIEPLLVALDAASAEPLHWRWQPQRPTPAPGLSLCPRGDSGVHVHLPWTWLQTQSSPGDPCKSSSWVQAFEWPRVPATIRAGQLRLSAEELDELEPGGAVLWHMAGMGPWNGRLVCEAGAIDLASVELCGAADVGPLAPRLVRPQPAQPAQPARPAAPTEGHGRLCELRLELASPFDPRHLIAGHADANPHRLPTYGCATLWQCAEGPHAERRLASGQLMPWGDAWALAIESLCD